MLNRTARLVAAVAVATLALPAAAGSWPQIPVRKAPPKVAPIHMGQAYPAEEAINGFIAEPGENVASLAPVRYFTGQPGQAAYSPSAAPSLAAAGFDFVGGETGWQPTGHKFVWVNGAFAHSEECDHAIRVVAAPTPAQIESAKRLSPGV